MFGRKYGVKTFAPLGLMFLILCLPTNRAPLWGYWVELLNSKLKCRIDFYCIARSPIGTPCL